MTNTFDSCYQQRRLAVEDALDSALPSGDKTEVVREAMRYSLLGNGKRIRGVLALASYELFFDDWKEALPAAVAVEMIHAYSLIHDDLPCMDDDDLRRGRPSCHIAYGEAVALLAGDGLLTKAFEELATITESKKAIDCVSVLSKSAGFEGMIRGQELDLASEGHKDLSLEQIREIHRNKTAKLIQAASVMGAVVGGADELDLKTLSEYSSEIGFVFQIVDDILDVTSDNETLGKPTGSDDEKNKNTFVSCFGLEQSRKVANERTEIAKEIIRTRFGDKAFFLMQFADYLLKRIN